MTTERPKYVYVKPNGRDLYFKHPKSGKLPIPALDAPEFQREYERLLARVGNGTLPERQKAAHKNHMTYGGESSVGELAKAYFASNDFEVLAHATQYKTRKRIEGVLQTIHPTPVENDERVPFAHWRIDEVTVEVARHLRSALVYVEDKYQRLRRAGDTAHWRDARMWEMRKMFNWGVDHPYKWVDRDEHGRVIGRRTMTGNPFGRLGNLYMPSGGHRPWTDDDCDTMDAYLLAEGLHMDRLAYGLCRYAAVRLSDVVRLGPKHVRLMRSLDGLPMRALVFKEWKGSQSRTDRRTNKERVIPIVPELWEMIERADGMTRPTFIVGARGQQCSEELYGGRFNRLCRDAELPDGCTMHGIRKYVGNRLAEKGATPHQIGAMLGHMTRSGEVSIKNVMVYSANAEKRKLTDSAITLIVDNTTPQRKKRA